MVVLSVNNIRAEAEERSNLNYAFISDKKAAYEIANNKSTRMMTSAISMHA